MRRADVVVIGGGLAGIETALCVARGGGRVLLIERRARLGGLTWSFQRKGRWFDNGQHVFLRCCSSYLAFLDAIGAADQVQLQPHLDIPVLAPGGRMARISRSSLPAPLHLVGSLARYSHLSVIERLRLGRAAVALKRLKVDDPSLDEGAFGSWLSAHGQNAAAIADLWNLITLPTLNIDADSASLQLAAMVFRTGLIDRNDAGDIGWSRVPLSVLHGDNAATTLEKAGVKVLLSTQVTSVDKEANGRFAVGAGDLVEAGAVVIATPPEQAEGLLGDGVLGNVQALGQSPILNVHLVFDRKVTDLEMFACVRSPVQFVFDRTATAHFGSEGPRADEQCLSISVSGADAVIGQRPEELISTYREALSEVLPEVGRAGLVDAVVTRERSATFRASPGSGSLRPRPGTAADRVFVAGAWCDTGWPATMEGAVRSGRAAGSAALARLGTGGGSRDLLAEVAS
ncbi:MAG: hydroxysqualene dehydroxylase HpnE [Acidimicrobiales bacterium]